MTREWRCSQTSVNLPSCFQSTLSWRSKCIDITLTNQNSLGFSHICCWIDGWKMQQDTVRIQHLVLILKSCAQIDVNDLFLVYTMYHYWKNMSILLHEHQIGLYFVAIISPWTTISRIQPTSHENDNNHLAFTCFNMK